MLNFKEIDLTDKPVLDKILNQLQPEISDFTFTNFYMWRHSYGLSICYDPELNYFFLFAKPKKWKPFYFVPLGDWTNLSKMEEALHKLKDHAAAEGIQLFFRRVPETAKDLMLKIDSELQIREDRNTFDYLYQVEDLVNLSGRKYHAKRNHLNQFLRKYQWEYQTITPEILKEILALHEDWFNIHLDSEKTPTQENQAMASVLEKYFELNLVGGVLRLNNQIQAISVGERLNDSSVVIHIEKANTEFSGIYVAINQQFLSNHWQQMKTVNREEDMGLEGLRKAKLSYHPISLLKKYNIYK